MTVGKHRFAEITWLNFVHSTGPEIKVYFGPLAKDQGPQGIDSRTNQAMEDICSLKTERSEFIQFAHNWP